MFFSREPRGRSWFPSHSVKSFCRSLRSDEFYFRKIKTTFWIISFENMRVIPNVIRNTLLNLCGFIVTYILYSLLRKNFEGMNFTKEVAINYSNFQICYGNFCFLILARNRVYDCFWEILRNHNIFNKNCI